MKKVEVTKNKNGSVTVIRSVNENTSGKPWILLLSDKLKKTDKVELTMNKDGTSGSFRLVK